MIRALIAAFAVLALTACAPLVQKVGRPDQTFAGPRFEQDAFVTFDGTRLGLQHWDAPGEPWAVIVGLHGMNDYSNAFHLAAPVWAKDGITTYAFDQRGYGRSPRRGVWGGREAMTEDLRTAVALARQRYPHAVIAVAGISIGGAISIDAFASDRPPAADRLVLLSPAVWGWSHQPAANVVALWAVAHTFRGAVIKPPRFLLKKIHASDNVDELIRMGNDPLMLWGARPDAIYGAMNAMQRASKETADLKVPTLYAYGNRDDIIPKSAAFPAAAKLPPPARTAYYPGGHHLLLIDLERARVIGDVEAFLRNPQAPAPSGVGPIPKVVPKRHGAVVPGAG